VNRKVNIDYTNSREKKEMHLDVKFLWIKLDKNDIK
jgi:hypothetical protein